MALASGEGSGIKSASVTSPCTMSEELNTSPSKTHVDHSGMAMGNVTSFHLKEGWCTFAISSALGLSQTMESSSPLFSLSGLNNVSQSFYPIINLVKW